MVVPIWIPPFLENQATVRVPVCVHATMDFANLMLSFIVWRKVKISTEEFLFFDLNFKKKNINYMRILYITSNGYG